MRLSLLIPTVLTALFVGASACATKSNDTDSGDSKFITVRDGEFYLGDSIYRYMGANFWYGAILASEGQGGDRERLRAELDTLHALGLDNLRILVGGDGVAEFPCQIRPTLQTAPGVYNDTILRGLDYLLSEMEQRGMHAVLYLNNAWEWSGGYGTYLEWAGHGKCPMPSEGYREYCDHVTHFVECDTAKAFYYDHVKNIVGRISSVTGKPYAESPAIMSWQIANEPRPFSRANKEAMAQWLDSTARLIKSIDKNHLVSTGSEGKWGFEGDTEMWAAVHKSPNIDYANIHIWPYNWRWISDTTVVSGLQNAIDETKAYVDEHVALMAGSGKPIVLEEFGYPRDGMSHAVGSPVEGRDAYFAYVLSLLTDNGPLNGANFWGWGGLAKPNHDSWQPGDDYSGDPAQEPQGLNSVFAADSSTVALLKAHNRK